MEQWIHLAKTLYMQYAAEIVTGLLACVVILTIITLFTVRRCKRQVKSLNENTKEFMKYSLSSGRASAHRERGQAADSEEERTEEKVRRPSKEDEEVFGSVIREMFS